MRSYAINSRGGGTEDVYVTTGPQLTSGSELAQAASQALGTKMEFESIDKCVYALLVCARATP